MPTKRATADSVTPNITSRSKASRSPTIHCSCPCGSANTRNVYASSPAGSSRPRIIRCERRRASPQWTTCWAGGVGIVRGYQALGRQLPYRPDLQAVGPWNKNSEQDTLNRDYFEEFVEIVVKALTHETFSHQGKFWTFPPEGFVNPHPHSVYADYGRGVAQDMRISEVGIAPRPLQSPHPQLYGGFTASMTTAKFWAQYAGRPIVLAEDLDGKPSGRSIATKPPNTATTSPLVTKRSGAVL